MLQAERSVEASGRLENLKELVRAMEEYETLGDFLEHVSLVMDNDAGVHDEAVTIMTIHAAKGLEFNHVFCAGWEDGVFPSHSAQWTKAGLPSVEEERRLAYVAITRAREKCTITHAANRRIYGQWTSSIPSRFIDELPAEHIESRTDDDRRRIAVARQLVRTRRSLRPSGGRQRHARRPTRPRLAARGDQRRLQCSALTRLQEASKPAMGLGAQKGEATSPSACACFMRNLVMG
jgi:DNA helicase-2/ATP-dependent DNA helicase PcrA